MASYVLQFAGSDNRIRFCHQRLLLLPSIVCAAVRVRQAVRGAEYERRVALAREPVQADLALAHVAPLATRLAGR